MQDEEDAAERSPVLSDMAAGMSDETASSLLQRCGRGDRTAFRYLYERQSARLYGLALRITRQQALAADAVHDTFVSVWQYAARFDPARGAAEAWLTSIVRYRAMDLARRSGREITGIELPEQPDDEPDPLSRLVGSSEGEALRRCLEELEPDRRELITQAFIGGLTHSDLSRRTSMPLGTVKSLIRRGLATLRKCLEP